MLTDFAWKITEPVFGGSTTLVSAGDFGLATTCSRPYMPHMAL